MAITAGSAALASDFISTSDGSSGKVPKLTNGLLDNSFLAGTFKFGGTGADGALSISSGTTTLSAASAASLIKNYTSISITGTGKLAFSNPATNGTTIILKSTGNVTLTSSTAPMIDASGMGAAGGAASNNPGSSGVGYSFYVPGPGLGGGTETGGSAPTLPSFSTAILDQYTVLYPWLVPGAGGGSGSVGGSGSPVGGVGGRGGGALVIECGGAWNFTTASGISVAGINGGNGSTSGSGGGGGGGGGGAGVFIGLYKTLTANSGTVTTTAGVGGNTATGGSSSGNGGGGGASLTTSGSNGIGSLVNGTQTGGTGGTGLSLVEANTTRA